ARLHLSDRVYRAEGRRDAAAEEARRGIRQRLWQAMHLDALHEHPLRVCADASRCTHFAAIRERGHDRVSVVEKRGALVWAADAAVEAFPAVRCARDDDPVADLELVCTAERRPERFDAADGRMAQDDGR